jgi:hypothetical protein
VLRRTHGTAGPLPWPGVAADLEGLGAGTADQLRALGNLLSIKSAAQQAEPEPAPVSVDSWISTSDGREVARRQTDPAAAVRVLDLWGWLTGVASDSHRVANGVRAPTESR